MSTTRTTKSIEALSASFNRALAGARQPQVTAAMRVQQSIGAAADGRAGRRGGDFDRIAARRRTNLLIGTMDRFRTSHAAWVGAQRPSLPSEG